MKTPKNLKTDKMYIQLWLKSNGEGSWQMMDPNKRIRKWEKRD